MYEKDGYLFNEAGQIIGLASSTQDFGQQATGYGAILQPFDANLGNVNILPGGDTSAPNIASTDELMVGKQYPTVNVPAVKEVPTIGPQLMDTSSSSKLKLPSFNIGSISIGGKGSDSSGGGGTGSGGGFLSRFAGKFGTAQAMAGLASGIGGIIGGLMGRGARRDAQIKAQQEYDRMRAQYMDLDTRNIYAGVRNKY